MGQEKKLIKYVNYFKTLKEEIPEEKEIIITKESTKEEVAKLLKNKFNLSTEVIEILDLDGDAFFVLEEDDFDDVNELSEEEKVKLKKYLKELKEKSKENQKSEIFISSNSTKEEIAIFLKNKLNCSENSIDSLGLDGEALFSLTKDDINYKDKLSKEEKDKLINYLDEIFYLRGRVIDLLLGIIYFMEVFNEIRQIQVTDFINELKSIYESIKSEKINEEEIKRATQLLLKYNYDVKKEKSSLIEFYQLFFGKKEALLLIKKIKDSNFEIRNLGEFIDEKEWRTIKISDIDNFLYVYNFFKNIIDNQEIKTDEELLLNFQKYYDNDKDIKTKLKGYLYIYPEIIFLYKAYDENNEIVEIIYKILKKSTVYIFKEKKCKIFIYKIEDGDLEKREISLK